MSYWIWVTVIGLISLNPNVLARSPQQVAQGKPQNPAPDFTCPEEFGYFPHPDDCTQYYVCVFGGALLESCTGGLMYSHDLQTCDWPRNVNCGLQQGNQSSFVYDRTVPARDSLRERDYTLNPAPRPTENIRQQSISSKLNDNSDLIGNVVSTSPKYSDIRFQDDNQADGSRLGRSYEQTVPNYKEEIYAVGRKHSVVKRQTHYYGPNPGHDNMYPSSYWRQRDLDFGTYAQQHHRYVKSPEPILSHYGKRHRYSEQSSSSSDSDSVEGLLQQQHNQPQNQQLEQQSIQNHNQPHVQQQSHHHQQTNKQQQQQLHHHQQSQMKQQPQRLRLQPQYHPNHHYSDEHDNASAYEPQKQRHSLPLKMYHENVNHRFVIPKMHQQLPKILMNPEPKVELLDGFEPSSYWTRGSSGNGGQMTSELPSNSPLTIDDTSVNGGSGKTTPAHSQQEIIIDPEYLSQRYAANVQPQQPVVNSTSNLYYDDSAYYIYDEEKEEPQYDDVDYKTAQQQQPQKPQVIQQQQPIIIQTTTRRPVPVAAPTTAKPTRSSSRGSARHKSSSGNRPTLKPSSTIVKDVQDSVRDVYVDAPTRPLPVYETPVPNTPATKCRKDECALPDCFCGGKAIPGDLPVNTVPQIVLLTFDDSVNDLNKDLYRDLFEKGRKNPNGCPISATFYVSHEWTDYSQVQNLAADGHEIASHSVSHSFGEQFSQKKWDKEIGGQREILAAYGGVKLSEVRGMRAPFLSVGGNNMFKMLYDSNFTYDSSMPVYENRPPSWPYTLDHKLFHDCMIPPCPTKSYPGIWEVPMVMWQDLKGGRCSMGDACSNPPTAEGVYNMLAKNFERHYTTNRAPFGLYYHAAWFTQPHHKEGFEAFLDTLVNMDDVFLVTNYQALQWVRNPTPLSHILNFEPWSCHNTKDRPRRCNHPKVCNLWHKSGVRYMKTCQQCPSQYPWVGNTGVPNSNTL